jgi:WD40 repeat protein
VLRHPNLLKGVAFSPDGKRLVTATQEALYLWDARTGRPHGRPLGNKDLNALAFSPDGRLVIAASGWGDDKVRMWEAATGRPHGRPFKLPGAAWDLAVSPNGRLLATNVQHTVLLLEGGGPPSETTLHSRGRPARHSHYVWALAFSRDGTRLASTTRADGTVWLWDTTTGQARDPLLRQPDPIQALEFSPDGKWLATGSDNGIARLWDAITGEPGGLTLRHQGVIRSVTFSQDGRFLATGSMDRSARVWDLSTGQPSSPRLRHANRVHRVAMSPDGRLLATASWDGTARLWRLPAVPTGRREMELRTWVELGARLDAQGNPVAIPWQQWCAYRDELRAIDSQKARAEYRDPWWVWSGQGQSHARRGEWQDAIACYSRAIRQGGGDWQVWWRRGEAYAALGQQRKAASDYSDAFRQGADWLHAVPSRGGRGVRLQWRSVPYAVGYHIYRLPGVRSSVSGIGTDQAITQRPVPNTYHPTRLTPHSLTETVFTDAGLVNGELHVYGVAPLFKAGSGQTVEAPPVTVRAALAVPGFCGFSINEGDRPGSVRFDRPSGRITLRGSGANVSGIADQLYSLSRPVSGDFRITVTALTRPTATDDEAQAGLMIRGSLAPNALNASLMVIARKGLTFQWRLTTGGDSDWRPQLKDADLKLPITLRLTRRGNTIIPEYSSNGGEHFQPAGDPLRFPQPLPQTLFAGLTITSHAVGQTSEAMFQDLILRKE